MSLSLEKRTEIINALWQKAKDKIMPFRYPDEGRRLYLAEFPLINLELHSLVGTDGAEKLYEVGITEKFGNIEIHSPEFLASYTVGVNADGIRFSYHYSLLEKTKNTIVVAIDTITIPRLEDLASAVMQGGTREGVVQLIEAAAYNRHFPQPPIPIRPQIMETFDGLISYAHLVL